MAGFVCISFWESSTEGKYGWAKKFKGWRIKFFSMELTRYHFWLWLTTIIFLLWPIVIYGFNKELLGIIISAWFFGWIIEDFLWFVVNPEFKFKDWNAKKVKWYPWLKIRKFEIPWLYILHSFIGFLSYWFLWR